MIWYEGDGTTPDYLRYLRAKDLTNPFALALVPISLPDGATITGFAAQYSKVAQGAGLRRNASIDLVRGMQWGTAGSETNICSLSVYDADGTTSNSTKSQVGLSSVVDNDNFGYYVSCIFHNTDSGNSGANGLTVAAFKVTYSVLAL